MSHEATMWAVKVRGISCTEARVLWHLADCHNPIFGCYPKQDYLATACEIDERSVRRSLASLRDKGHVNWIEQREGKNRKANRYSLAFEDGFRRFEEAGHAENQPDKLSGSSDATSGQNGTFEPDSNDGLNRTPESSIEPVREPVIEPVRERGRVRAASDDRDEMKTLERRFDALRIGTRSNPWPNVLNKSKDWAFRQFLTLTPEERLLAEDRRDDYLAACPKVKAGDRKGQPDPAPLGIYLRDKLFNDLVAIAPKVVQQRSELQLSMFGPLWAGMRMVTLLRGPVAVEVPDDVTARIAETYEVKRRALGTEKARAWLDAMGVWIEGDKLVFPADFYEQEYRRRVLQVGYPGVERLNRLASERGKVDGRNGPLADFCEAVPIGSPVFEDWRAYHVRMNWPFVPDPGGMRVVYFPRGGPDGLKEFETAAKAVMNMERGNDSDAA